MLKYLVEFLKKSDTNGLDDISVLELDAIETTNGGDTGPYAESENGVNWTR